MKRHTVLLAVLLFAVTLVVAVPAFAEKPAGLTHEIIVSADGDGDFTNLTEAVNSITDASATNRYLITLKPGSYTGAPSFAYIDINGSGKGNTTITSALWTVAGESTISNLTVSTTSAMTALYINGDVTLEHVNVSAANGNAVLGTGSLKVIDSSIYSPYTAVAIAGSIYVDGSYIEGGFGMEVAAYSSDTIRNSEIVGTIAAVKAFVENGRTGKVNIYNSRLAGPDAIQFAGAASPRADVVLVSGSELAGNVNGPAGSFHLVNCFDASFAPIANQ
jgi:hypothetical protein